MNFRYAAPLVIAFAARAFGQCTPVDCLSELPAWGGLCSATFAEGRIGVPYSDAISFHVTNACTPATLFDPTLTGVSIRITQLSSVGFSALPGGLVGTTNQASYAAPANGCASLDGVPSQAGVFEASVDLVVNVNAWPFSLACGGFGPIAQNGNEVSFPTLITILPDPSFSSPDEPLCLEGAAFDLIALGTPGGVFSGPGVSGNVFDPAIAGVGTHSVKYIVSAQDGGAIAVASDSLSIDFIVEDCSGGCTAFSGTLGGVDFIPCLEPGGSVELIGIPGGDAVVPDGYEIIYVLTQGAGLTIIDAGPDPVFEATETGLHTIHTLVYDPTTLDLGIVEFGVTTGFDVNGLLIQGGGEICASLDVSGAAYVVTECADPCEADAGTTNGPGAVICLVDGEAQLLTSPNGDAVVPDGFIQTCVLTSGTDLVVIDGNGDPEFTVSAIGEYRIHSLVIDPLTFQLAVEPGVTTGLDVLDYFATEGVCGDLDPVGAEFVVDICDGVRNVGAAGFSVYPNPSAGGFFVVPDMDGQVLIEMLDVSGRTAFQLRMPCTQGVAAWVVTDAAPGSYAVRLSKGQERWEQRMVIQP